MITAEKKYYEWTALLIISFVGIGISLWGYWQILNLPAPTSLNINRAPKIIFIFSPQNNAVINNPVAISGKIVAPEKTIKFRIKDANNNILRERYIELPKEKLNLFNASIEYKKPTATKGLIQFLEFLPEDDMEINHRSIPVSFLDYQ